MAFTSVEDITLVGSTNRCIALSAASMQRKLSIGSDWSTLVITVIYSYDRQPYSNYSNTAGGFNVGLISSDGKYFDNDFSLYVGWRNLHTGTSTMSGDDTFWYNPDNYQFIKSVAGSETIASNSTSTSNPDYRRIPSSGKSNGWLLRFNKVDTTSISSQFAGTRFDACYSPNSYTATNALSTFDYGTSINAMLWPSAYGNTGYLNRTSYNTSVDLSILDSLCIATYDPTGVLYISYIGVSKWA